MKKLNKLFAILIAVLGVGSLSAQTWTASDVSAGTYYLYNVGADKFLCSGNNWGSHASVTEGGIPVTLAGSGNVYTISTAAIYTDKYLNEVWMDGGSYDWTFEKVSDKVYRLKNGSNVLYWNGGTSTNTTFGTDPGTTASQWMLVTEEARVAALANATQGSPIDATFLIKNAYFAKGNGSYISFNNAWNVVSDLTNSTSWKGTSLTNLWGNDSGNEDACYAVEQYGKQFDNYQELQVPNGKYFMTTKGFYRGNVVPYIYANSEKCNLKAKGNIGNDNLSNAAIALNGNDYLLDGVTVVITNGSLRVGVKSDSSIDWCVFDDFKLVYYGKDLTLYENALSSAIETAQSIDQAKLNVAITNNLNKEIANSQAALNDANKTVESLEKQTTSLNAIIETANNSIAPYATLRSLIDLCTEYTQNSNANSTDALTTFQTAINTATTNGNAATSADAINAAYNTLESARQTYAQNAVPVYPYAFDMTFLLANPNFDSNIDGWTASGAGRMSAGNIECYNTTFTFALANKLTGLGNGTWEVSVDGFYRYGGYNNAESAHNGGTEELNAKLYANASEVALKSIMDGANQAGSVGATTTGGARVPDSPADGNSYFPTGCYKNTVSTLVTDGTLTFGLKKEKTQGSDWTLFDNFRLVYKGIDVSELQTNLTTLVTSANSIKDTKMGSTESTNLIAALDAADASATDDDELNEMLSSLQGAYDAAVASIDTYSKVPAYITKANKIDESIAASIQTQYNEGTLEGNAETIFQNLEVATYNHVTTNFNYNVALNDTWNSTGTNTQAATFSNEHWSGETREYKNQEDGNNWGWGAQSWSIDFDQEVTLPAGEYVFKVAGRKSEGTTLELVVTMGATVLGTVNDFPASNNSRGINKLGATSFDPEDEAGFARNGEGFGWQWRYVKFTLNAESTVKVAVHAEANSYYQWVSFGDYTLQMTEETYLEANKHGLDAPTAAAQALVNAVPMGSEEIEVLQQALDMTYTTGAELLAKIEALNAAAANAEAWVPKYNEAKAPLVAALERFEADYNDAQNGALDYMNKSRWATAISMAQAAAEAKDVTNSYAGFISATNKLVEALNAVTTSIGEYAALDGAIKTAKPLYEGGNWGDKPFQKPTSVKESLNTAEASAAYNTAEADGEEVTSITAALNEAIDNATNVVLNAPAEGQKFYIKVASEGHSKYDNAVLATLGNPGENNPTGYGLNANNKVKPYLNQAFTFTQVEDNLYNISIERTEGTIYLTYGELNGSAAEWNKQQIQATTDAEKMGEFMIVSTGKDGILKIFNTADNNFLDCQDGGSIYTDTGIENEEFTFELATEAKITLTISEDGWATWILPFDAELPEGVKAYSCSEINGDKLTLVEAGSLKANTPYLVNYSYENDYNFSGYGLADKDSYTDGLFTGTYVEYQATGKAYVLQNINSELGFYLVGEENVQSTVDGYNCYITYEAQEGEKQTAMFLLSGGQEDDPTAIEGTERKAQSAVVVYDLMGRKVSSMEKGNMYIINGVKVLIK